jgi:hypothetical protein
MTIYIFTGPTLSAEEGRTELAAEFLPPAGQGDVYRAALTRPRAIGIIDGYFERVPAVWHKEILWAMSQGIHVFGSASMGALRAGELSMFGMEGIGVIYDSFRSGALEDDDEVAVAHGAADTGYRALSEAMVNIRATFQAAEARGVVSVPTRSALERIAKALFYPERCYPTILSRAINQGLPAGEIEALRAFLPRGRVNQKRSDALSMLRRMRERLVGELSPRRVRYTFEHTDTWEQLIQHSTRTRLAPRQDLELESLVEELALTGDRAPVYLGAAMRALSLAEARRQGVNVTEKMLQTTIEAFFRRHGLVDEDTARHWIESQGMDETGFHQLMHEEAQLRWIEAIFAPDFARAIPAHLRANGEHGRWSRRAKEKQRALSESGLSHPSLTDAGLTEEQLWKWYFETRIGTRVPDDLWHYAQAAGFESSDDLRRTVLREYCYLRLEPQERAARGMESDPLGLDLYQIPIAASAASI